MLAFVTTDWFRNLDGSLPRVPNWMVRQLHHICIRMFFSCILSSYYSS